MCLGLNLVLSRATSMYSIWNMWYSCSVECLEFHGWLCERQLIWRDVWTFEMCKYSALTSPSWESRSCPSSVGVVESNLTWHLIRYYSPFPIETCIVKAILLGNHLKFLLNTDDIPNSWIWCQTLHFPFSYVQIKLTPLAVVFLTFKILTFYLNNWTAPSLTAKISKTLREVKPIPKCKCLGKKHNSQSTDLWWSPVWAGMVQSGGPLSI